MSREKKIAIGIIILNICIVVIALLYDMNCYKSESFFCSMRFWRSTFFEVLAWFSLIAPIATILALFMSDKIFKKWLKFTFWWFLVAIIWIAISPDSVNFLAIPATKENVSIWMSVGFVIISLIMFIWMSMKGEKE